MQDLRVENLNTYNDYFACYKDLIENTILSKYEDFLRLFSGFDGFIMNIKGNMMLGKVPGQDYIKDLVGESRQETEGGVSQRVHSKY